jgi:hypothetical protein
MYQELKPDSSFQLKWAADLDKFGFHMRGLDSQFCEALRIPKVTLKDFRLILLKGYATGYPIRAGERYMEHLGRLYRRRMSVESTEYDDYEMQCLASFTG